MLRFISGQSRWVRREGGGATDVGPRAPSNDFYLVIASYMRFFVVFFCDIPPIGFLTITSAVQTKFGPLTRLGPGPPTNFM